VRVIRTGLYSQYHPNYGLLGRPDPSFQYVLMFYIHETLFTFLVEKHDPRGRAFSSEEDQDQCFNLMSQLEDATICEVFWEVGKLSKFLPWLFDVWEVK
jgi:hypothetical protein